MIYDLTACGVTPDADAPQTKAIQKVLWMAPFMILGYKFGRLIHLPQLKIKSKASDCAGCGKCNAVCPMSVDVKKTCRGR